MAIDRNTVKKLQKAINLKFNQKIVVSANQWYSNQANRPITTHIVKQVIYDEQKGKNVYVELFKSTSLLQVGLFLRDRWYELNGWELPENVTRRKEEKQHDSNKEEN